MKTTPYSVVALWHHQQEMEAERVALLPTSVRLKEVVALWHHQQDMEAEPVTLFPTSVRIEDGVALRHP